MDDLISRQQAINAINEIIRMEHSLRPKVYVAKDAIKRLPLAQPEIIRCKDCIMHGVCRFEQGLGLDGYCSQAERRTDG